MYSVINISNDLRPCICRCDGISITLFGAAGPASRNQVRHLSSFVRYTDSILTKPNLCEVTKHAKSHLYTGHFHNPYISSITHTNISRH